MEYFTNISSIILFIISIVTFLAGLLTKAQNDGKVLEKIEQIQRDITEIKIELKEKTKAVEDQRIITENQEQRIKHLEQSHMQLDERLRAIEKEV